MRHFNLCIALGLAFGTLRAQDTTALAPGVRVRVWTTPRGNCEFTGPTCPYRWMVGTLDSIDSVKIVLRDEEGTLIDVPHAANTRLDMSRGRGACSAHRGNCVAIGFFGGVAVGALAGFISVQSQGGASQCGENLCELVYLFTIPAGAVVGTIIGAVVGREHWEHVEPPVRVALRPDERGHIALGVSVPF